jgi:hypothetical protein
MDKEMAVWQKPNSGNERVKNGIVPGAKGLGSAALSGIYLFFPRRKTFGRWHAYCLSKIWKL